MIAIPLPLIIAFGAAGVGLASGVAIGLQGKNAALAEMREVYAKQREAAAANAARWDAQQRAVESRRLKTMLEIADASHIQAAQARADAEHLERIAGVLRAALVAAYTHPASHSADTPAASSSAPASGPGLVPTDVFRWADPRLRELAAAYDQSRIAGLACERAYDALTRE